MLVSWARRSFRTCQPLGRQIVLFSTSSREEGTEKKRMKPVIFTTRETKASFGATEEFGPLTKLERELDEASSQPSPPTEPEEMLYMEPDIDPEDKESLFPKHKGASTWPKLARGKEKMTQKLLQSMTQVQDSRLMTNPSLQRDLLHLQNHYSFHSPMGFRLDVPTRSPNNRASSKQEHLCSIALYEVSWPKVRSAWDKYLANENVKCPAFDLSKVNTTGHFYDDVLKDTEFESKLVTILNDLFSFSIETNFDPSRPNSAFFMFQRITTPLFLSTSVEHHLAGLVIIKWLVSHPNYDINSTESLRTYSNFVRRCRDESSSLAVAQIIASLWTTWPRPPLHRATLSAFLSSLVEKIFQNLLANHEKASDDELRLLFTDSPLKADHLFRLIDTKEDKDPTPNSRLKVFHELRPTAFLQYSAIFAAIKYFAINGSLRDCWMLLEHIRHATEMPASSIYVFMMLKAAQESDLASVLTLFEIQRKYWNERYDRETAKTEIHALQTLLVRLVKQKSWVLDESIPSYKGERKVIKGTDLIQVLQQISCISHDASSLLFILRAHMETHINQEVPGFSFESDTQFNYVDYLLNLTSQGHETDLKKDLLSRLFFQTSTVPVPKKTSELKEMDEKDSEDVVDTPQEKEGTEREDQTTFLDKDFQSLFQGYLLDRTPSRTQKKEKQEEKTVQVDSQLIKKYFDKIPLDTQNTLKVDDPLLDRAINFQKTTHTGRIFSRLSEIFSSPLSSYATSTSSESLAMIKSIYSEILDQHKPQKDTIGMSSLDMICFYSYVLKDKKKALRTLENVDPSFIKMEHIIPILALTLNQEGFDKALSTAVKILEKIPTFQLGEEPLRINYGKALVFLSCSRWRDHSLIPANFERFMEFFNSVESPNDNTCDAFLYFLPFHPRPFEGFLLLLNSIRKYRQFPRPGYCRRLLKIFSAFISNSYLTRVPQGSIFPLYLKDFEDETPDRVIKFFMFEKEEEEEILRTFYREDPSQSIKPLPFVKTDDLEGEINLKEHQAGDQKTPFDQQEKTEIDKSIAKTLVGLRRLFYQIKRAPNGQNPKRMPLISDIQDISRGLSLGVMDTANLMASITPIKNLADHDLMFLLDRPYHEQADLDEGFSILKQLDDSGRESLAEFIKTKRLSLHALQGDVEHIVKAVTSMNMLSADLVRAICSSFALATKKGRCTYVSWGPTMVKIPSPSHLPISPLSIFPSFHL